MTTSKNAPEALSGARVLSSQEQAIAEGKTVLHGTATDPDVCNAQQFHHAAFPELGARQLKLYQVSDDEIQGGARVRLIDDQLEIDLSDRAVAQLISQRLVPRFKSVLEGLQ